MKINEAYKTIRTSDLGSHGDMMFILEYMNGDSCPWSITEKKKMRLLAADQIDKLILKDIGVLLDVYTTYNNTVRDDGTSPSPIPIIPGNSDWAVLRKMALPLNDWEEERKRRCWDDTFEAGADAVCSERILEMKGFSIEDRYDYMKELATYCHLVLGCRNNIFITDKASLPDILKLIRKDEECQKEKIGTEHTEEIFSVYLSLQKLLISPLTEEVGLVFSPDGGPMRRYVSIIIGDYVGDRLKSTLDARLPWAEIEERVGNIVIKAIISSMDTGTETVKLTTKTCCRAQVEDQYYYLDWSKAERSARNFSGDPGMKKAVKPHTIPNNKKYMLSICESPAIIIDTTRAKALGFVFKNGIKEKFLITDGLIAFKITGFEENDDGNLDKFNIYEEVVDRLNESLASTRAEVLNKALPLPGMQISLCEEDFKRIVKLSLSRQSAKRSIGEDPCLEPVQGANLKPYLDSMVAHGYLIEEERNRYRKTRSISDEALVLFAYLLNDKIAKAYEGSSDYEKRILKKWYNEKSWCGKKPEKPGIGFDALEEWRTMSDKKKFLSMEEDKDSTSVVVSGTRTIRTSYFSNLLSIPERKITKNKSAAIEDESKKNEVIDSFEQVWTKGKRAKVLKIITQIDGRTENQ